MVTGRGIIFICSAGTALGKGPFWQQKHHPKKKFFIIVTFWWNKQFMISFCYFWKNYELDFGCDLWLLALFLVNKGVNWKVFLGAVSSKLGNSKTHKFTRIWFSWSVKTRNRNSHITLLKNNCLVLNKKLLMKILFRGEFVTVKKSKFPLRSS